jgi:hypothetical protein
MDSFVWNQRAERSEKAFDGRHGALPYQRQQWLAVFPDGERAVQTRDGEKRHMLAVCPTCGCSVVPSRTRRASRGTSRGCTTPARQRPRLRLSPGSLSFAPCVTHACPRAMSLPTGSAVRSASIRRPIRLPCASWRTRSATSSSGRPSAKRKKRRSASSRGSGISWCRAAASNRTGDDTDHVHGDVSPFAVSPAFCNAADRTHVEARHRLDVGPPPRRPPPRRPPPPRQRARRGTSSPSTAAGATAASTVRPATASTSRPAASTGPPPGRERGARDELSLDGREPHRVEHGREPTASRAPPRRARRGRLDSEHGERGARDELSLDGRERHRVEHVEAATASTLGAAPDVDGRERHRVSTSRPATASTLGAARRCAPLDGEHGERDALSVDGRERHRVEHVQARHRLNAGRPRRASTARGTRSPSTAASATA